MQDTNTKYYFLESVKTRLQCEWVPLDVFFFRQTVLPHRPKYQICYPKYKIQNTKYYTTRLTSGWLSAPRRLWGFQAVLWSIAGLLAETKMLNRLINLILFFFNNWMNEIQFIEC